MAAGTPAPQMPEDRAGHPIQVLAPDSTTARIVNPSLSANVGLPSGAQVIEISLTGALHVRFGTSGVTAADTDFFLPAGFVGTYRVPPGATHVAAIYASGTSAAVLYVHKLV